MPSTASSYKILALTATKAVLDGGVGRILGMARANLRNIPRAMGAGRWSGPTRHGRDQTSTAPELLARRAAWNRFHTAFDALEEQRAAFVSSPNDLTAEQVRWAEVELEDAVAVAGEFQLFDLPWSLA